MTREETLVAGAVYAWKQQIERAEKTFVGLTDAQLRNEIAPGKNRLIYLWGHLIAVHDAMLPLLRIGPRLHPELDAPFLTEADRSVAELPSAADLKRLWDEVNSALLAGFGSFTAAAWAERHGRVDLERFGWDPPVHRRARSAFSAARQIELLTERLRPLGDPARAAKERAYLKSALDFWGVSVPSVRRVAQAWVREHPELTRAQ